MKNLKIKNLAVAASLFSVGLSPVPTVNAAILFNGNYIQSQFFAIQSFTSNPLSQPGGTVYVTYTGYTQSASNPGSSGLYFVRTGSNPAIHTLNPSGATNATVVLNNSYITTGFYIFNGLNTPFITGTITDLCIGTTTSDCVVGGGGGAVSVDLSSNAFALRSVYNIQSAALNAGLSYDCNVFDKQGICLSTGGRYSTANSPQTSTASGLLIGSYKYDKNIRLGAWIDQNLSTNNTDGVKLGNSKPLLGVFGVWSERNDGLGYEVKVSAGYGDKDIEVTRTATNQGSAKVTSKGIQSVSSYGIAIDSNWIAAPYAGVKYVSISRGGYTEGGSNALTYDTLRQETTSAVAGVRFTGKIDPKTFTVLSAGVEHDLDHNVGQYSAGSSNTTVFNQKPQKTRPVVTAGIFYDIDKTQRVGLNAIHRQEAFQTTTSTTALATYTVGF